MQKLFVMEMTLQLYSSYSTHISKDAAKELKKYNISAEVIDLRTLSNWMLGIYFLQFKN